MRAITIMLLIGTALADEKIPPRPQYNLKHEIVRLHGLPGDRDFYEIHESKIDHKIYYVDVDGKAHMTLDWLKSR